MESRLYLSMTDMMGAIMAEALTAEMMSAPTRYPRLEVFHRTTSPDSTRPFLTEGMGIVGADIDMEDEQLGSWSESGSSDVVVKGMMTPTDTCHVEMRGLIVSLCTVVGLK